MLLSVPLITGALGLASSISIDARVKTDILLRDYCGLGVHDYVEYLVIDNLRWDGWLADNEDPGNPGAYLVPTDICGKTINIGVTQQAGLPPDSYTGPPLGNPLVTIPGVSAYNDRRFQTSKTVSIPNPAGGSSINYTITVINRDTDPATLVQIQDTLPAGFAYDWTNGPSELTLPGMLLQYIDPTVIPGGGTGCAVEIGCIGKADVVLVLDNSGSIDADELAILKEAAKLLVDSFYLHETYGTIIGVTRFNWSSSSVHVMSDDAASLKAAIDDVDPAPWWAFTNIVAGLNGAAAQFATGPGRPHSSQHHNLYHRRRRHFWQRR